MSHEIMDQAIGDKKFVNKLEQDVLEFFSGKITGNLWPYVYGTPQDENDLVRGGILYNEVLKEEEDYYLYKDEAELFKTKGHLIASRIGSNATFIELGPGSEQSLRLKTLPLLRACSELKGYVGIDIAQSFLNKVLAIVRSELPDISVQGIQQDFTQLDYLPECEKPVIFFKGSTIANLRRDEVPKFIRQIDKLINKDHYLILIHDANQDEVSLMKAYNTHRVEVFIQNIMFRIDRDLDIVNMNPKEFRYQPEWDPKTYDFKHILVATKTQKILVKGLNMEIKAGQKLHTFSSFKYPVKVFQEMIRLTGYQTVDTFCDSSERMVAHIFERRLSN